MIWLYVTFGLVFVIIILILLVFIAYSKLKPIALPYLQCHNKPNKSLMLIFERKGTVRASAGDYISEMFEDSSSKTPLAFFKADVGGFKLGQADVELFFDGADTSVSPELAILVSELKRMGYRNIDEVTDAVRAGEFGGDKIITRDGIVFLEKGNVTIPLLKSISPSVVEGFSRGKPAITRAYTDTVLNIDRSGRNDKFYENPQIMGIGFIIVAGCLGIAIMKSMGVF